VTPLTTCTPGSPCTARPPGRCRPRRTRWPPGTPTVGRPPLCCTCGCAPAASATLPSGPATPCSPPDWPGSWPDCAPAAPATTPPRLTGCGRPCWTSTSGVGCSPCNRAGSSARRGTWPVTDVAEELERRFGPAGDPHNPLGHAAVVAADERGELLAAGE